MAAFAPSTATSPFRPDVALAAEDEPSLPLSGNGGQRWVWHGRYGTMLIEVIGSDVFVNSQRVEPHAS